MPLETASYIPDLNQSNPDSATDYVSQGDDHLRLIKSVLKNTFPNFDSQVTTTSDNLNKILDNITITGTTLNMHNNKITNVVFNDANSSVQPRSYNDTRYFMTGEYQAVDIKMNNNIALTSKKALGTAVDLISVTAGDVVQVGDASMAIDLKTDLNKLKLNGNYLYDILYPIGTIYENGTVSTNPFSLFGFGVWQEHGKGKVTVCRNALETEFDTVGETGGSKTHTLVESEMPNHSHGFTYADFWGGYGSDTGGVSGTSYVTATTSSVGGNGAHNNLQPYIVTYRWIRIA